MKIYKKYLLIISCLPAIFFFDGCKKKSDAPANNPVNNNNNNGTNTCDFTDTLTDNKLPLSAYCNGTEYIAEAVSSYSDSTGTVPYRIIHADGTLHGNYTQIDIYIENYAGSNTYLLKSNHSFGSYRETSVSTFTSGAACAQAGSVTINSDNNDSIKGSFHFLSKDIAGSTTVKVSGGHFAVLKQP